METNPKITTITSNQRCEYGNAEGDLAAQLNAGPTAAWTAVAILTVAFTISHYHKSIASAYNTLTHHKPAIRQPVRPSPVQ